MSDFLKLYFRHFRKYYVFYKYYYQHTVHVINYTKYIFQSSENNIFVLKVHMVLRF